jgi:hypothetical protein
LNVHHVCNNQKGKWKHSQAGEGPT